VSNAGMVYELCVYVCQSCVYGVYIAAVTDCVDNC